ncbi:Alternative oxidase, mitochondrial [Madurella mycetomatis]|uniref:Alternative oxidase n=1 Tax=Madurella mycetomatis TaxID=100816 RepID=A0A175W8F6_9PEZI|nr:Alternative oxidase, mitochondrial [Madurella mycetomatis]
MAYRLRIQHKRLQMPERVTCSRSTRQPLHHGLLADTGYPVLVKLYRRPVSTLTARTKQTVPVKQTTAFGSLPLTWPHKGWDDNVVLEVVPSHRKPRTMGDRVAWTMDFVTGMGPEPKVDTKDPMTSVTTHRPMTESQWMVRFIFLETIAGVPGIVAGTLRHLHSIRRFKPDQGWIKTLLEESYNERMHLLTFLEMYKPGWLMRFMVWAAQGTFYNTMFIAYLICPRVCHRFVGYLEEEAVHTYTRCIQEMDRGLLPRWTDPDFGIPEIAVKYWNMPEGRRTMRDLILYIRADEASHRGVNHTLGNLDQTSDPNPFIDSNSPVSHMHMAAVKPTGLEREEVIGKDT